MTSTNTGSSWHAFFHDWPLAIRVTFAAIILVAVLSVIFLTFFLTIEGGRDIEIGPAGIKFLRSETNLEKNCRVASQELSSWNQNISSEILALEAQVATKDHDFSETRQRCLSAPANTPQSKFDSSRCRTEVDESNGLMASFANPRNDYETELNNIARERNSLKLRIAAEKQERAQRQQRLDQRCLGDENHVP